jgi:hypothetical protein
MSLPTFTGYSHGKFMNEDTLKNLVKPAEGRRLLFAHNQYFNDKYPDLVKTSWIFFLTQGQAQSVRFAIGDVNYAPIGSSIDVIICLELFGIAFDSSWKAEQNVSDRAILELIKTQCPTCTATTLAEVTNGTWEQLKTSIDNGGKTATIVNRFYSLVATVIYSICRTGSPSDTTRRNLETELHQLKPQVDIAISPEVVKEYWAIMGVHYSAERISEIMGKLREYFVGKSIRLNNLVEFAKKRNLTQYYAIKEAITRCPNFPWDKVALEISTEMANYTAARDIVRDQDYYGYGPLGDAASSNYPNLAYLSVQICRRALGQMTLSNFVSTRSGTINKTRWDNMVDKFLREQDTEADETQLAGVRDLTRAFLNKHRNFDPTRRGMRRPRALPNDDGDHQDSDSSDGGGSDDEGGAQQHRSPLTVASTSQVPDVEMEDQSGTQRPGRSTTRTHEQGRKDRSRSAIRTEDLEHEEVPTLPAFIRYKSIYTNGHKGDVEYDYSVFTNRPCSVKHPMPSTVYDVIYHTQECSPLTPDDIINDTNLLQELGYNKGPRKGHCSFELAEGSPFTPSQEQLDKIRDAVVNLPYYVYVKGKILTIDCLIHRGLYPYVSNKIMPALTTLMRLIPPETMNIIRQAVP